MGHVTQSRESKFSQNFSSLAHTVWDKQCLEDSERKDDSMSNKGDCRTAQATPGPLINIEGVKPVRVLFFDKQVTHDM